MKQSTFNTKWVIVCIIYTLIALIPFTTKTCTGIMLKTKDGSVVHGRTVEFGTYIDSSIAVIPRDYQFVGQTPNGKGMAYSSKYATVGTITFNEVKILDGMNEKGLSVGAFYFPTCAQYTALSDANQKIALSPTDFPNWILTQFESVSEVRNAIEKDSVAIVPTIIDGWGAESPPFHYIVYEKSGASIVIEPLEGKLVIHDNPIGVITNSPEFSWHLTNLRNYISLNPRNVPPVKIDNMIFKSLGQGSGMLGLPGDFTPPSRFVRATVFSTTAIPEVKSEKGVLQIFHILNNFDIPIGIAREEHDGKIHTDYTMLTTVRDPNTLRYYYKTYDDQTIRTVDLSQFDFKDKKVKMLSTKSIQPIVDMTDMLQ